MSILSSCLRAARAAACQGQARALGQGGAIASLRDWWASSSAQQQPAAGGLPAAAQRQQARGVVSIDVVNNGVDRALRMLRRKLVEEGAVKEWRANQFYSKPSEERKLAGIETAKRLRKRAFKNKIRWILRRKARCAGSRLLQPGPAAGRGGAWPAPLQPPR